MPIEDIFSAKNGRFLLFALTLYLIGRGIYYLALGGPEYIASLTTQQKVMDLIFHVSIPMAIMTIMWPLIYACSNAFHEGIRLTSTVFYFTISFHLASTLLAAFFIVESNTGVSLNGEPVDPNKIYTVSSVTILTTALAWFFYYKKISLFNSSSENA